MDLLDMKGGGDMFYYIDPVYFIFLAGPLFAALIIYAAVRIHFGDRFYAREDKLTPEKLAEVENHYMDKLPLLTGSDISGPEHTTLALFNPNLTEFQVKAVEIFSSAYLYAGAIIYGLLILIPMIELIRKLIS
jgi:hypothetical protein